MKLDIKERLLILGLLPKESNFLTLKIKREFQGNLGFSEKEVKELEFVEKEGMINWNPDKEKKVGKKEIEIGEKAMDFIINPLKEMNEKGKLNDELFDLYERFVIKNELII